MELGDLFPAHRQMQPLAGGIDGFAPLYTFLSDPQYIDMDRIISFQDSFVN
jgi:hypothetical protein